jgi:anti-anti-sigma factor
MITHTYDRSTRRLTFDVSCDILSTTVDSLDAVIQPALQSEALRLAPWTELHLNLRAVKMIDSMGLNLLVNLVRVASSREARVSAVITRLNLHRLFLFTRLDRQVALTVEEPAPADAGAQTVTH